MKLIRKVLLLITLLSLNCKMIEARGGRGGGGRSSSRGGWSSSSRSWGSSSSSSSFSRSGGWSSPSRGSGGSSLYKPPKSSTNNWGMNDIWKSPVSVTSRPSLSNAGFVTSRPGGFISSSITAKPQAGFTNPSITSPSTTFTQAVTTRRPQAAFVNPSQVTPGFVNPGVAGKPQTGFVQPAPVTSVQPGFVNQAVTSRPFTPTAPLLVPTPPIVYPAGNHHSISSSLHQPNFLNHPFKHSYSSLTGPTVVKHFLKGKKKTKINVVPIILPNGGRRYYSSSYISHHGSGRRLDSSEEQDFANEIVSVAEEGSKPIILFENADHVGEGLILGVGKDQCVNVPKKFNDRTSSVKTFGNCFFLCEHNDCFGSCKKFKPGVGQDHTYVGSMYNDRISSVKQC